MRDGQATRDALIEAAGELFAEVGFAAASVRSICERAGANVASVHYHFGGKEALFRAVCDHLFARPGLAPAPAEAEGREAAARALVAFLVERLFAVEEGWRAQVFRRELFAPTPMLADTVARHLRPLWDRLDAAVARVSPGDDATGRHMLLAGLLGELLFLRNARPLLDELHGVGPWSKGQQAELTDRATRSLLRRAGAGT